MHVLTLSPSLTVSLAHPRPLTHPLLSLAGEITTTSLLDRETKSEYILIVRAVDGGVGHNQKTGIATVSVLPSHAPVPLASQAAAPRLYLWTAVSSASVRLCESEQGGENELSSGRGQSPGPPWLWGRKASLPGM